MEKCNNLKCYTKMLFRFNIELSLNLYCKYYLFKLKNKNKSYKAQQIIKYLAQMR